VVDIILDNSLQHGAGETRIDTHPAPGGIVISISDQGSGIATAEQEAVFQRHQGSGNGIGLALARTLVEADGGRLLLADPARAEFRIVLLTDGRKSSQKSHGPAGNSVGQRGTSGNATGTRDRS